MRGPNPTVRSQQFADNNRASWLTNGQHIADIENYKVLQDGLYYSLWDTENLVAYCTLTDTDNEVDDVWVNAQYRGKKVFSMMLWFFKTRLNRSPLKLGEVHSSTMQEVVKGLPRFKKYWLNLDSNETKPFSVDTVDEFYDYIGPTRWRLMLENSYNFNWPMFNGTSFITEEYMAYIE